MIIDGSDAVERPAADLSGCLEDDIEAANTAAFQDYVVTTTGEGADVLVCPRNGCDRICRITPGVLGRVVEFDPRTECLDKVRIMQNLVSSRERDEKS